MSTSRYWNILFCKNNNNDNEKKTILKKKKVPVSDVVSENP